MKKIFISAILCLSIGLSVNVHSTFAVDCIPTVTGDGCVPGTGDSNSNNPTNDGTSNSNTPTNDGTSNSNTPKNDGTSNSNTPSGTNSSNPCNYNSNSTAICNPISGATDAKQLLIKIIKYILGIISLVAVTVIVISGFRMVISQGNESQVKAAKSAITWAIIGLAVSVLAYSIIAIVDRALTSK